MSNQEPWRSLARKNGRSLTLSTSQLLPQSCYVLYSNGFYGWQLSVTVSAKLSRKPKMSRPRFWSAWCCSYLLVSGLSNYTNWMQLTSWRLAFLPVMAVTLPLPTHARGFLQPSIEAIFQWFAFFTFAVLLTVPWLVCVYRIVVYPFGRKKQIKHQLDEKTAPKVMVVMPVYKEPPESLSVLLLVHW